MSGDFTSLRARLNAAYQRGPGESEPARIQAVLEQRRRDLAARQLGTVSRDVLAQAFVFRRASTSFAVALTAATEAREIEVATLPGSGSYVNGVFQIRGRCTALVDLAPFFGQSTALRHRERSLTVVVSGKKGALGLRVDEIVGVRTLHVDEIEPNLGDGRLAFIRHITRDGVHVVDVDALVALPEIHITASTGP